MSNKKHDPQIIQVIKLYRETFHSDPEVCVFAPGRCNLIGEHTDYNEGFVLPFALPYKTVIAASKSPSGSNKTVLISGAFAHEKVEFTINKDLGKGTPSWANYIKGTVFQYLNDLPKDVAFQAAFIFDVPIGGGLSSSAALEVATATMLEKLYNLPTNGVDKALRCQKAEQTFADVPCGIMDQYISALGKEGNLLLVDCRSNHFELVPFGGGNGENGNNGSNGHSNNNDTPLLLITNSNVKHSLGGSEYPDRVRQCKEAVTALKKKYPQIKSLRDATHDELEEIRSDVSTVVFKRARHVIDENSRTLQAVECLKARDYKTLGELMKQSHNSLKDDYEVSCEEIDFLVKSANSQSGVFGSRITGGGFGGCTVTLVERGAVKDVEKFLRESYYKQYHKKCDCYETTPSPGATVVEIGPYLKLRSELSAGEKSNKIKANSRREDGTETEGFLHTIISSDYLVPVLVGVAGISIALFYTLRRKGGR